MATRKIHKKLSAAEVRPLRPIRNERDHGKALQEITALWDATDAASKDRLEVLSILVEAYERVHHAVQAPSAVAAIQFRMEQRGMSRADLGVVVGSRSRATEILSGARQLSLEMIRNLHRDLKIPLDVLLLPAAPKRKSKRAA